MPPLILNIEVVAPDGSTLETFDDVSETQLPEILRMMKGYNRKIILHYVPAG